MHLHILVSGVSNGSHIGLYGNLQISEYSYDGTSNTQTHGFSELHTEDYFFTRRQIFHLTDGGLENFQMQRRVKLSCHVSLFQITKE